MYYNVYMSRHKPVASFRIEEDLIAAMQRLFARDGIAPSEQIRRALRPWLEKKGVLRKKADRPRARTRKRS